MLGAGNFAGADDGSPTPPAGEVAGEARPAVAPRVGGHDDRALARFTKYLPIRLGSGLNGRGHWALHAPRIAEERKLAYLSTWPVRRIGLPCDVTLTRIGPRRLDDDNVRGVFKAIRDGIADRLGIKDNDPRVTWRYEQERDKHYGIRITVEAA